MYAACDGNWRMVARKMLEHNACYKQRPTYCLCESRYSKKRPSLLFAKNCVVLKGIKNLANRHTSSIPGSPVLDLENA